MRPQSVAETVYTMENCGINFTSLPPITADDPEHIPNVQTTKPTQ